jgi:hypothetical protein
LTVSRDNGNGNESIRANTNPPLILIIVRP